MGKELQTPSVVTNISEIRARGHRIKIRIYLTDFKASIAFYRYLQAMFLHIVVSKDQYFKKEN